MNMMRFILDCLRPARARSAAAARDVELQAQGKDTSEDIEIKGLKDEVHIEEETLQTTKALCRNTQETVEKLEERKTLLKEELEMIHDLQKQEREVLQCLQEQQQELEQTLQQYDTDLSAAAEDLLQLQRDVAYAKTHAESLHVRIAPLQDVFQEIVQVKNKLSELVAGLITGECTASEITEDHCVVLDQDLDGKMDDVESKCDSENILSEQEGEEMDHVEQESAVEELDKMQRSLENLKSSGSSSFTEITLTEVKEEDVMFRSTTPQSDSSDMEKEDFEIIQPSQATNRQFDFFHPNPFTDGDVFGDDHFPKVDVTEQLPRDPFKGTDPFASDSLLVATSDEEQCPDAFTTEDNSFPDTLHYPFQSAGKDYGTFNAPINMPLGDDFKQTSKNTECSESTLKSCPDADVEVERNATRKQIHEYVEPEDVSPEISEEFVHESGSSSTISDSFEVDPITFAEVDRVETKAGPSFIKGPNSLCGLQSIIAGSYTGFPLSPCDPEPVSGISDIQKIFEHHIASEQHALTDKVSCHSELEDKKTESVSPDLENTTPGLQSEHLQDINSNTSESQPNALDVYDYKYGDMFFFTVRLDPGSPELHSHGPVCPETNDIKKDESNDQLPWKDTTLSPEFNGVDELDCCSPKSEDTEEHNQNTNGGQNGFDNRDPDYDAIIDPIGNEILESDSERSELPIPRFTFDDSDACQSVHNSEWDDEEYPNAPEDIPEPTIEDTPKSTDQDLLCMFSNTDTSTTDQVCADEQLLTEFSSSQKPSENSAMSKYELQYFDPFSPIPAEPVECASDLDEINTANSFSHEAPRLDSGYHEVGTPTYFSQEPTDKMKCSIDLQDPGLATSKQSDSEIHVADPFSPESVDTGIFDSETENCEPSYMTTKCQLFSPLVYTDVNNVEEKQMSFINNVSCDILSDHLSGSEPDDCFPFGSCPSNEESYAYSSEGLTQDGSDGEFKPGSMMANASNSSELMDSAWRNSEMSLSNADMFDPMKNTIFDFDTTDVGSFMPDVNQHVEDGEKVTKKADLVEIDYFCSELSKMVSSSSSDSVQQSVAEMLFGSEPNASSFYPWDFEKQQQNC
ncbi:uncharacterized protein si:ch73-140j24.4 [Danio aesculapii]|uniref:uncharacterized protein si:ch73-140j24.4 n=1 Tax=Danio aesculapii TaxID=1142201 RepID=UPI0024BFEE0C|nr:uncharacterized protein si:ch73-140j24.4 [Danio aesculapii]